MGNVFGKEKTLKEQLRENKRMINRAVRELDRERAALEREEKRLTIEIKKMAKEQQMGAVRIMAKVRPFDDMRGVFWHAHLPRPRAPGVGFSGHLRSFLPGRSV
mmetsp:Transcript_26317/g.77824  ORF Transcript_26317/g.77824 Transcript_26317/m.77824 type:complete len:104 (-) Transcript_26317:954-1265(-)